MQNNINSKLKPYILLKEIPADYKYIYCGDFLSDSPLNAAYAYVSEQWPDLKLKTLYEEIKIKGQYTEIEIILDGFRPSNEYATIRKITFLAEER